MGQQKTTPLLPFLVEIPIYREFHDGSSWSNYSHTTPVNIFQHLGHFTEEGSSKGGVCSTTPVACALCLSWFEPHDGRRGVVFYCLDKLRCAYALNTSSPSTMVAMRLACATFSMSSCRKSQLYTVILAILPNSMEPKRCS